MFLGIMVLSFLPGALSLLASLLSPIFLLCRLLHQRDRASGSGNISICKGRFKDNATLNFNFFGVNRYVVIKVFESIMPSISKVFSITLGLTSPRKTKLLIDSSLYNQSGFYGTQ